MEQPEFDVLLTGSSSRRLDVIQAIRAVTGLSAWRSSQLLGSLPAVLLERLSFEIAKRGADRIRASGGGGALFCRGCERVISLERGPVRSGECVDWSCPPCPARRFKVLAGQSEPE